MGALVNARNGAVVIALASAAILASALGSQYFGGLHPCELCIWQRWPYVATTVLALAAFVLPRGARRVALALAGLVFLAGAGIAAFHVGVEQGWWQGLAACGGNLPEARTVEEMRAALMRQPVVRCDEVAWSLFGISMAGWNFLLSIGLAALSFAAAASNFPGRPTAAQRMDAR